MANCSRFVVLVLACLFLVSLSSAKSEQIRESYVVYMGSPSGGEPDALKSANLRMLSSIITSAEQERISLTRSYHHAFEGFSAVLTEEEAAQLSGHERVVSVFRDRLLELHTTRSWDFLEAESGLRSVRLNRRASSDVITGIVDSGIWPESPSFNDAGMSKIPSRWRGVCMEAPDFNSTHCNRKIIGARVYVSDSSEAHGSTDIRSPRDYQGHGTHTTSTAAGAMVTNADYYGLAQGTARGGSPSSRIAMYKACTKEGCLSSDVLKAIDDAVRDGVDIISLSIGSKSLTQPDFLSDAMAIGAFHAQQNGVLVVCSAGNEGPDPFTVINAAPWILTVGASTIDRSFQSSIVLGNGNVVKGVAINFSNQSLSGGQYSLVLGPEVARRYISVSNASNCSPGSLDARKAAGKIVVCVGVDPVVSRKMKLQVAIGAGAKGLVLVDDALNDTALDAGSFPFSQVGTDAGAQIFAYLNSTKNPTAVILATEVVKEFKPAPVVASFSSRGPGGLTDSILKPDLMAPGVNIVSAGIPPDNKGDVPAGKKPSSFGMESGTSMSCPHVAGAAAFVKSAHPGFSPSMIRSALMTTATAMNNVGQALSTVTGVTANSHDMGAGEVSPLRALSPGLGFETTTEDYLKFLCYYGYKEQLIRKLSGTNFACSPERSPNLIASNVNYPSISVPRLFAGKSVTVTRTATNVGPANSTYVATVDAPPSVAVNVSPERLVFSKRWMKASYEVSFGVVGTSKGYSYGSIVWSDGKHSVRTVFAVNVV